MAKTYRYAVVYQSPALITKTDLVRTAPHPKITFLDGFKKQLRLIFRLSQQ